MPEIVSTVAPVDIGVPQGSVLGPLLFSLYLADFETILNNSKYNFYADDLHVYIHCEPRNLSGAIHRLNEDIASILNWTADNCLVLNAAKTQAIIMGTARYLNFIDYGVLPNVTVDGTTVRFSSHVKYLGVTISSNLSWETHVTALTKKIWAVLYRLKLCRT